MRDALNAFVDLFTGDAAAATTPLTGLQALQLVAVAVGAALGALLLGMVVHAVVLRIGRRSVVARTLAARLKGPFRWILVTLAAQQVFVASSGTDGWLAAVRTVLLLAVIACVGWLVAKVVLVVEDLLLEKFRVDVADNRHARRIRTQIIFLRRIALLVIALLTVGAMLWTFPEARVVGTGIFASAGLLSVVAGLAAQSSLSNVFAGLQLAFTDALRVDDVVVVEGLWGRIEEITLTYVVVHVWDDRRYVLPSTYFTSTPFEHWTRKDSQLLGVVMLEVDWRTDLDGMREELHRVVEADELWDRRVAVLQVTDAVNTFVQVRILVSAADGPTIFDLRCHVREAMVRWLVASNPDGLPRLRVAGAGVEEAAQAALAAGTEERVPAKGQHDPTAPRRVAGVPTPATTVLPPVAAPDRRDDSLFTGSMAAVERSRAFAGPSESEQADRVERMLREERERLEAEEREAVKRRFREDPDPALTTSVLPTVPEKRR
ncbi:mechanosensitive ion channel [Quadrisphaera sp. RL12-1S]|uniref:mechanosensitive ion channel family protein n=1 Tax=Quadrisphaera sp. RL12-1S TaxID=2763011 RepID=UPI0016472A23|nr:mechanosensitive ion channel domain-containing protein [Quadrisphaera sp. RL12-1S]MBC3762059.1 mechanosensitive ion channel [Quadrisphaera sp. RL12-1S]